MRSRRSFGGPRGRFAVVRIDGLALPNHRRRVIVAPSGERPFSRRSIRVMFDSNRAELLMKRCLLLGKTNGPDFSGVAYYLAGGSRMSDGRILGGEGAVFLGFSGAIVTAGVQDPDSGKGVLERRATSLPNGDCGRRHFWGRLSWRRRPRTRILRRRLLRRRFRRRRILRRRTRRLVLMMGGRALVGRSADARRLR